MDLLHLSTENRSHQDILLDLSFPLVLSDRLAPSFPLDLSYRFALSFPLDLSDRFDQCIL